MEVLAITLFVGATIIGVIINVVVALSRVADATSKRRIIEYAHLGEWSKYIGMFSDGVLMFLTLLLVLPVEFFDKLAGGEIVVQEQVSKYE